MPSRLLVLPLSFLALVSLILAACQSPDPSPVSTTPTQVSATRVIQPTATSTPLATSIPTPTNQFSSLTEQLHGTRVHFEYAGSDAALDVFANQVREFNASNSTGIWIEAQGFGSFQAVADQVNMSAGTENQPDLVLVYPELAAGWEKLDLTPYLNDPQWGLSPSDQSDIPAVFRRSKKDSPITSLPAYRTALILAYNQAWAQELGFTTAPATPAEFQQQACAAAQDLLQNDSIADNGLGGWIVNNDPLTAASWLRSFGVDPWMGQDGAYQFNVQPGVDAFAYMKEMFAQGCAWVARNPQPFDYFANRQALFYATTPEDLLMQQANPAQTDTNWAAIAFPALNGSPITLTTGPDWVILPKTPREQLAAWIFVRWMLDPTRQAQMAQASGDLPVRTSAKDQMGTFLNDHPQWATAWQLATHGESVPIDATWIVAGPVLQDAFGQLFHENITEAQVPGMLAEADRMITELLARTP